jgi:hypothetical protein
VKHLKWGDFFTRFEDLKVGVSGKDNGPFKCCLELLKCRWYMALPEYFGRSSKLGLHL